MGIRVDLWDLSDFSLTSYTQLFLGVRYLILLVKCLCICMPHLSEFAA